MTLVSSTLRFLFNYSYQLKSLKMYCVKETSEGLAFPWNIPCKRGNAKTNAVLLCSLICLLAGSYYANNNQTLFFLSSIGTLLLILGCIEIITRLCAMFEEWQHLRSRYEGSILTLFKNTFYLTTTCSMVIVISFFICIVIFLMTKKNPIEVVFNENWLAALFVILSMGLFKKVFKLEESPLNQSLQFEELKGCDYGSGMAHSFFHGYLRIVLPHTGIGNDKGLKEFQEDYEARNNIKFAVYKIFILIPMSQNCPPSLGSGFSPSVEPSKELECKEIDRAGVKNRNYKNSVYKISTKNKNDIKYVTAEYATPVKTLAEVMKQNTRCARMYMKHRKEILLNFYLTLRDLLKEDEDCCDLCEVIYYDDKNEKGEYRDVGQVILSRLKHILKKKD